LENSKFRFNQTEKQTLKTQKSQNLTDERIQNKNALNETEEDPSSSKLFGFKVHKIESDGKVTLKFEERLDKLSLSKWDPECLNISLTLCDETEQLIKENSLDREVVT
jgi:hypothetical protein